MKRELVAVLLGLACGLAGGLFWRSHQATEAEARAHRADSLYQARLAQEVLDSIRRLRFDRARADSLRVAQSALAASAAALTAIRTRAAGTTARARAALAQAASLADTADTYRSLYEEAAGQRDDALAAADSAHAAAGRLLAIIRSDSLELQKERGRTADWKRAADSLDLAVKKLLKHRRPEFNLKLGLGGFAAGAVTATLTCVISKRCG
jgi:hypothetical protein